MTQILFYLNSLGTKYFRTNEVKILRYEILIHNPKCTWEWSVTLALAQLVYKGNYYSIKCKQFYLVVMCLAGLIECWVLQLVFLKVAKSQTRIRQQPKMQTNYFFSKNNLATVATTTKLLHYMEGWGDHIICWLVSLWVLILPCHPTSYNWV